MKKIGILFFVVIAIIMAHNARAQGKMTYPETRKADTVDNYFGIQVADPYRWLEDDRSAETEAWVKKQNKLSFSYLESIPFREKIRKRLRSIWDYPKYSVPFKAGNHYFFRKNDGMQDQSVLYIQDGLDQKARVFMDPNKLSEDGTVALGTVSLSTDGKYMGYSINRAGSDWTEIHVREVPSGQKLTDKIEWVKFSGVAWKDHGFYYSRYAEPVEGEELSSQNKYHKVYYHRIGTDQHEDELVFENKEEPLRNYYAQVTEDERFLIIYESESTHGNAVYCKDLKKPNAGFKTIMDNFDSENRVIDNNAGKLVMMTNLDAPRKKLVLIDPEKPDKDNWASILPQKDIVLQGVTIAGENLIAQYMKDASSRAYVYSYEGKKLDEIPLPGLGTLAGFSGKKNENIAFYAYTSFTFPATIYKYNVEKNKSDIHYQPDIDFNANTYVTEQIFYKSKDGTQIPMFITHKKGLEKDGSNPTLLYGYGGFNVNLTPFFSLSNLIFLENGGIFVLPNIRGGGEYGEEWHQAGIKMNKQNVFDDFIAAAEYLIDHKYTSPEKLAINGGSNGGLLVGACMTQRPELFQVALPAVGVMDMLRYHKFTIGWAWAGDYGTSEDSKEMFEYLHSYSPLHNLKKGTEYPATLVTTADHDDRVVPAHSFKYAATLQEKHEGDAPALIRIATKAGHGAGKPTSKIIEEQTDKWSFIFENLGVEPRY